MRQEFSDIIMKLDNTTNKIMKAPLATPKMINGTDEVELQHFHLKSIIRSECNYINCC